MAVRLPPRACQSFDMVSDKPTAAPLLPNPTAALDLGAVALGGQALGKVVHHPGRGVQRAGQAQHITVQRAHAVLHRRGGWEVRGRGSSWAMDS